MTPQEHEGREITAQTGISGGAVAAGHIVDLPDRLAQAPRRKVVTVTGFTLAVTGAVFFAVLLGLGVLVRDYWLAEAGRLVIVISKDGCSCCAVGTLVATTRGLRAGDSSLPMIVVVVVLLVGLPGLIVALVTSHHVSLGANSGMLAIASADAQPTTFLAPLWQLALPVILLALAELAGKHLPYDLAYGFARYSGGAPLRAA